MKPDAELFYFATAFFAKRVFVFGDWQDGHLAGRWISKRNTPEILEFARKVSEAGGFIYLDGQKYRYLVNPNTGPQILVDGWSDMRETRAHFAAQQAAGRGARNERSEAATPAPEAAERTKAVHGNFTCLVTRKVSLTDETKAGIRS